MKQSNFQKLNKTANGNLQTAEPQLAGEKRSFSTK